MVYFPTLAREIAGRNIKKKAIAESINVCAKTLNNKLCGRVPFTWPEVSKIRSQFFPDLASDVLFAIADQLEDDLYEDSYED